MKKTLLVFLFREITDILLFDPPPSPYPRGTSIKYIPGNLSRYKN